MVTMKLRQPYTTASIWSSGKITCTGANSEDQARVAARRYARVLQSLGYKARSRSSAFACDLTILGKALLYIFIFLCHYFLMLPGLAGEQTSMSGKWKIFLKSIVIVSLH
jgi:hypothetical protein